MVELSVVVPTTIEDDAAVPVLRHLPNPGSLDLEYEVIVRRDPGASTARNEGIERASGEKIVFLDDDSVPEERYLEAVSAALDERVAVTGRVVQPDDAPFSEMDVPWYDQGDEPKPTTMVAGCNMAVRRSVLEEVGGFNETFDHGHEETELAHRISERYDIVYDPSMVVEHPFAESVRGYWRKEFRHGKADVLWWTFDGWSRRKRVLQSLALLLPVRRPVRFVGSVVRFAGRLYAVTLDLLGRR